MIVSITQESQPDLAEYARIPIAFQVCEVAQLPAEPLPANTVALATRPVPAPWIKDYDAVGGSPSTWASHFDLSHWTFFIARVDGRPVGAAAAVLRAADIDMLAGRQDVALLWDIRVLPDARGHGVGSALVAHVAAWAASQEATWLEVETQDINVPACRFYARNGFVLRAVNHGAYPDLPDETQLLWYKRLGP
jgi:GNAT superfamily N-acetyltransferase